MSQPEVLDEPTLMQVLGGRRGLLDSALPALTFVITYLATGQNMPVALTSALVVGGVVAALRLARKDSLRHVLAGFAGVALSVAVVNATGRPVDYFLPSLLANVGAAVAWAVSIWVRRPLLGVVVGTITRSKTWRTDPRLLGAYQRASWIWTASFVLRVIVMTPLWLSDQLLALGVMKVVMGWPMVLVVIWLSWQVLEPAYAARRASPQSTSVT
ncbi:MAG: DUF3159 domain-containing protein [Jiangellales bacterium]